MADPASAASLGLGAASLAIQLFQGALIGYSIFTTARSFVRDVGVLQAQILIQEQLLLKWGDGLGLTKDEEEIDDRLKTETGLFNAVVATLCAIKSIFIDLNGLKKRYGVESTGDSGVSLSELAAPSLLHGVTLMHVHKIRKEELEEARKRLSLMKHVRWAITDKGKFESLIAELAHLNDGLYSLIPPLDARILAKAILAELLRTTDLEKLWRLKSVPEKSNIGVAAAAGLKHLSLTIHRNSSTVSKMELPSSSGQMRIIKSKLAASRRSIGTYGGLASTSTSSSRAGPVFIEWKNVESSLTGELKTVLETRVNSLAYFLQHENKPDDLRALNCLGYIKTGGDGDDSIKYGLVYTSPSPASGEALPMSLFDLLPEGDDDETNHEFDVGDKFKLAQVLSQSLYELHVCDWLHKGICSDNILYFQHRGSFARAKIQKISLSSPFLVGYEFARPGRLREVTQKPSSIAVDCYAHPLYRKGNVRYHRLFDIYSLGVVLLEIGLWRRIESGVSADQSPEEVRDILVETCNDELGPAIGGIYREVVRCCLQGDFPVDGLCVGDEPEPQWEALSGEEITALEERDERINGDLTEAFYWKVVKMLGKCCA